MSEFYKKSYFNRRNWIMEHYASLQLDPRQGMVLLMVDFLNETEQTVSIHKIAQMMGMELEDVDTIIQQLTGRQFLKISTNSRGLVFSIDPIFTAMQHEKSLPLFQTFEDAFMRPLSAKETLMLKEWQDEYESEMILYALREAVIYRKQSFPYIEAVLKDLKVRNVSIEQLG